MTGTVILALAAAFWNAVSLQTQHSASVSPSTRQRGRNLASHLVRQPLWLFGWVAAIGGFVFQALALHNGSLSVVQTLLVTELVFMLVMRRLWIHQQVSRAAWASVVIVCVALAVFLSVAEPHGGHLNPNPAEWLSALLVFSGIIAGTACLGLRGSPVRRAAFFAVSASLTWALMATFIKATTDTLAESGIIGTLAHWPVYALAATAAAGTFLQQAALHVGPLSVSQPLVVVVDPVASIILSVWLFDERFTNSPAAMALGVASFAVMVVGVTMLSRAAPAHLESTRPVPL